MLNLQLYYMQMTIHTSKIEFSLKSLDTHVLDVVYTD